MYSKGSIIRTPIVYNATNGVKHILRSIDESKSLNTPLTTPEYIALDLNNDKLYFSDTSTTGGVTVSKIFWASLSNPATHGNFLSTWNIHNVAGLAWDNGHGYPDGGTPYYDCHGHGTCLGFAGNMKCSCQDGWSGNCNISSCPVGLAWFDEAHAADSAHRPVECSNGGVCDRGRGECNCFEGFEGAACDRMKCPSTVELVNGGPDTRELACGGRGKCLTMKQVSEERTLWKTQLTLFHSITFVARRSSQ